MKYLDFMIVKLLKDFKRDDLIFKKIRKTSTGSRIIDVEGNISFQTGWLKILYDVDYNICVNTSDNTTNNTSDTTNNTTNILAQIDEIVINHSSNILDFTKQEIIKMYRPLLKQYDDSNCFRVSISSNTILFDKNKNFYDKSEIKNILKQGHYVRFIFTFKKIYFKNHELTFPLELQQIELA